MAPILLGVVPFALVSGAVVIEAGLGFAEAIGMSLGVFAGAAQLAAVQLWADGAPLAIVIGTALVINARFIMYSGSIAPVIGPGSGRLRPFLGYLLTDQAYAVTMSQPELGEKYSPVPYFLGAGVSMWIVWQACAAAGALAGAFIPDSWSLDFAVPLVFLALLVPAVKSRADLGAAVISAALAVVLVPVLPLQTGLLVAIMAGIVWGSWREAQKEGSR